MSTTATAPDDTAPTPLVRPFHLAVPVHNLEEAKAFYGGILQLPEGRSSHKWQDYNLYGNQLVVHWVGEEYRGADYFNPVDGDEVPVAHFGACLTSDEFDQLAGKVEERWREVHHRAAPALRWAAWGAENHVLQGSIQ